MDHNTHYIVCLSGTYPHFCNACVSAHFIPSADESKVRLHQQELEQSWVELEQAVAGREEAEQNLQQIQAQLEDTKVTLERVRCELLSQQEQSEQGEAARCAPFRRPFSWKQLFSVPKS